MLRQGIELLFFAYRDFTAEPDAMLARYGFGRAHHRVIYFVGRHPQMTVSELLGILRITKQSLCRVLGELVGQGFIVQRPGPRPATAAARADRLGTRPRTRGVGEAARARRGSAYREAGKPAVEGFRKVMLGDHRRRPPTAAASRPPSAVSGNRRPGL